MSPGPDEDSSGSNAEEGKVLSPEELDISKDERVKELDDGRYVVSSGDPIASGPEPAGQIESGPTADTTASVGSDPDPEPDPTPQPAAPEPDPDPEPEPDRTSDSSELTAAEVHEWLSADLDASNSRYGFDVTASFDGSVSQQRMVSNDVVTIFENLVMWYAQQIDRQTPVEEVLGIMLMEANVPVRYPPNAVKRALQNTGLSPDDSIADLMDVIGENEGFQL